MVKRVFMYLLLTSCAFLFLPIALFAASTGGAAAGGSGSRQNSYSLSAPHSGNYGGSIHRPGDLNGRYEAPRYGYGYRAPQLHPGLPETQGTYPTPSYGAGGENITAPHYGLKKDMAPHPGHLPRQQSPIPRYHDIT